MIIHNEKEVRSIVKKAIFEASKREGGSAEFGSFGGVDVKLFSKSNKKKNTVQTVDSKEATEFINSNFPSPL